MTKLSGNVDCWVIAETEGVDGITSASDETALNSAILATDSGTKKPNFLPLFMANLRT